MLALVEIQFRAAERASRDSLYSQHPISQPLPENGSPPALIELLTNLAPSHKL